MFSFLWGLGEANVSAAQDSRLGFFSFWFSHMHLQWTSVSSRPSLVNPIGHTRRAADEDLPEDVCRPHLETLGRVAVDLTPLPRNHCCASILTTGLQAQVDGQSVGNTLIKIPDYICFDNFFCIAASRLEFMRAGQTRQGTCATTLHQTRNDENRHAQALNKTSSAQL
jgi:hypothetical protein